MIITINGIPLNEGQVTALRVACIQFQIDMQEPGALGFDATGCAIAKGYVDRLGEVIRLIDQKS